MVYHKPKHKYNAKFTEVYHFRCITKSISTKSLLFSSVETKTHGQFATSTLNVIEYTSMHVGGYAGVHRHDIYNMPETQISCRSVLKPLPPGRFSSLWPLFLPKFFCRHEMNSLLM